MYVVLSRSLMLCRCNEESVEIVKYFGSGRCYSYRFVDSLAPVTFHSPHVQNKAVYYVSTVLEQANERTPLPTNSTSYRPLPSPFPHQSGPPRPYMGGLPLNFNPSPPLPLPLAVPVNPSTQNLYIPANLVGGIIGKGGNKINELRNLSGCQIKISDVNLTGADPGADRVGFSLTLGYRSI